MDNKIEFNIDDNVKMKKGHPCGANDWKIIRWGADVKLQCNNCGRVIMLSRLDFKKKVKSKL